MDTLGGLRGERRDLERDVDAVDVAVSGGRASALTIGALAAMRPGAGEVAVAIADPHGFLVMHYAAGYDANRLRKDLVRLVKR